MNVFATLPLKVFTQKAMQKTFPVARNETLTVLTHAAYTEKKE